MQLAGVNDANIAVFNIDIVERRTGQDDRRRGSPSSGEPHTRDHLYLVECRFALTRKRSQLSINDALMDSPTLKA
jgi:hypothetical protein